MIRSVRLALLLPAVAAASAAQPSAWGPIREVDGSVAQEVLVRGKPFPYFRVARRWPIQFTVRGPARLVVLSRAEQRPGASGPVSYSVRVLGPHSVLRGFSTRSRPDPGVTLADSSGTILCERRRLVAAISEREQRVWISVSGAPSVFLRLLLRPPGAEDSAGTAIQAVSDSRAVYILEDGERTPYRRVTRGSPLRLRAAGTVRVELISRLELDRAARDSVSYALGVTCGGRTLRTLRYRTVPSPDASYADSTDRVPSRSDRAVLPLPPGATELTVELIQPGGAAAEILARVADSAEESEE